MTDWQPIETAPRDGTRVLIWSPGFKKYIGAVQVVSWRDATYFYGYPIWETVEGASTPDDAEHVTHWAHLPDPPKDIVKKKK